MSDHALTNKYFVNEQIEDVTISKIFVTWSPVQTITPSKFIEPQSENSEVYEILNASNRKMNFLNNAITTELKNRSKSIKRNGRYLSIIEMLASIDFHNALIDFSFNKKIQIILKIPRERRLYINLILSRFSFIKREAFFAYYDNNNCLYNGMGSIYKILSDISFIKEKIKKDS